MVRRTSGFLSSPATATGGSTSPPRFNTVPRRASRAQRRFSANLRSAYMHLHMQTGPRSSTRATQTGANALFLSSIIPIRDLARVRRVGTLRTQIFTFLWSVLLVADRKLVERRWNRIARVLLNPGDTVLVEEWTYPSALASARPIDVHWKSVPMDGQGMRPDSLRLILAGWKVERDGPRCVSCVEPSV